MFKVGNLVKVEGTGLKGYVLDTPAKKGHLYIDLSGKKMLVAIENLKLVEESKAEGTIDKVRSRISSPKSCKEEHRTLDLHGMRVKEAEEILLDFINNAVMDGVPMLTIIHGHGMGKLKEMVIEVLKQTNISKTYKPTEDGRAALVVYL